MTSMSVAASQDVKTVRNLRLGVGVVGVMLPVALPAGNWLASDRVIVPTSMSGSYYTSTRDVFVGSLCALGVFLIGYRHTARQDRCTWFAGLCALAVAFAPTAPMSPKTEPHWVNYLHHVAACALIFTLGLFCLVVFTGFSQRAGNLAQWANQAWDSLRRHQLSGLYLICGGVVFAAGGLALYTGLWPTAWSTGWSSLYCFEAIAVFAFGVAWVTAGFELGRSGSAPAGKRQARATLIGTSAP
jgi:hypothetical protein